MTVPETTTTLMLFPLASVVLFPATSVPLHVFEPRYRALTAAALAGDRTIGMIAVPPVHAAALAGEPPLFEIGCAGAIEACEPLPDGRYHILLAATQRFRILREIPRDASRPYRVAEVAWLEDRLPASDDDAVAALRREILEHVAAIARLSDAERHFDVSRDFLDRMDHVHLVNALSQALDLPTPEKQGLLEANGVRERAERLSSVLSFHLAERRSRAGGAERLRH